MRSLNNLERSIVSHLVNHSKKFIIDSNKLIDELVIFEEGCGYLKFSKESPREMNPIITAYYPYGNSIINNGPFIEFILFTDENDRIFELQYFKQNGESVTEEIDVSKLIILDDIGPV